MASGTSSSQMRWPWVVWALCLAVAVLGSATAAGAIVVSQQWFVTGGSPELPEGAMAQLQPVPERYGAGIASSADVATLAGPNPDALNAVMEGLPTAKKGRYGVAVAGLSGDVIYSSGGDEPMTPASTLKVMTSLAVIHQLGSEARFTTTVLREGDELILVGGGDPLLASGPQSYPYFQVTTLPTIQDLAAQTAEALAAESVSAVTLSYDDSLFTGPVWHPDWDPIDRAWVAPVSALSVDEAASTQNTSTPSPEAARIFAAALREHGIEVTGEVSAHPNATGEQIAAVQSARLGTLVQEVLVHSDNYAAEMLLRHLALARGLEPSFEGGSQALMDTLGELGIPMEGISLVDGSGMSDKNRLTAHALVAAIQHSIADPHLGVILESLPVSGASGSLTNRFADDQSQPGRGDVHAKTGSLDKVSSLAGYVITDDGAGVVFAMIGNDLPGDEDPRPWFDRAASAIADCECAGG